MGELPESKLTAEGIQLLVRAVGKDSLVEILSDQPLFGHGVIGRLAGKRRYRKATRRLEAVAQQPGKLDRHTRLYLHQLLILIEPWLAVRSPAYVSRCAATRVARWHRWGAAPVDFEKRLSQLDRELRGAIGLLEGVAA